MNVLIQHVFVSMICWKNLTIFGIKSAIVLKKNLIANPSTSKKNLKSKVRSSSDEARELISEIHPKQTL